jgi:mono/diheme cytochrome c family protein
MWFAIVSLILLASLVWMVFADYSREWKIWQKKFIELKTQRARDELKEVEAKVDREALEKAEREHAEAQAAFKRQKGAYGAIQKKLAKLDVDVTKAKTTLQDARQYEDSYRYFFEEYRAHGDPRAGAYEQKLKALEPEVARLKLDVERVEAAREAEDAKTQSFVTRMDEGARMVADLVKEKKRVERKLQAVKPTFAKEILNAPMVDFIAPTLRIQQIVLEDLYDDYHFAKTQKVDRCTTCHLAIDQEGYENEPQPFRTHPRLELFLASSSPHPLEKIGCTVCHGGSGHSVSFVDSVHTPRDEAQRKEWEKKYRWRRLEKWEYPMLPIQHAEASCAKCHHGSVEVPEARELNRGRKLAETYGCFGCHKIEGFENRWRVGPSLERVQSKLTREWIVKWLEDPKAFRTSTHMPRIFHLSNTSEPEDRAQGEAAIEAIAAYLLKNSETVPLAKPPVEGNPDNGKQLVQSLGCLGCHALAGLGGSTFGPELSHLGSKVSAEWLYTWLKNPKHYSPKTRMPNLRLTDQEAADITSFLVSQRNAEFDGRALPRVKTEVMDELVLTHLQTNMRRMEAEAKLAEMSPEEKLVFLGKESVAFQGCFACHDIKGFETAKQIATELSDHGRKDVHRLDFGLIHLDHTREAWYFQKLKEPRIFDRGKVKSYYEKLRMPQFDFSDEEAQALSTFILSLTQEEIPLEMQKRLNLKEMAIEDGRFLLAKNNCQGCHTLDGREGTIRALIEDPGSVPPILDGEGAKVQERWLHGFLKNPTTIRPWLKARMPTFEFPDSDVRTLIQYFSDLAGQDVSYRGHDIPETPPGKLEAGKTLFEAFQCVKCHQVDPSGMALGASFLAPDLALTKERLKPEWVVQWLRDPQMLQVGTMMPTFFPEGETPMPEALGGDVKEQIEAIRDYLFRYAPKPGEAGKEPEVKAPLAKEGGIS